MGSRFPQTKKGAAVTKGSHSRIFDPLMVAFLGGNDYAVKEAGVLSIQVRDPNETKRIIEVMVASLT